MSDTAIHDCNTISIPVPITVTVNTSASVPPLVDDVHSLSASQAGFTRVSDFTFTAELTGENRSILDLFEPKLSNTTVLWDFGDGYSLSAKNTVTTNHRYNVPGIYTVAMYLFDQNGETHLNTVTKSVSVYNYLPTNITIDNSYVASISAPAFPASSKNNSFNAGVTASWQDVPKDNKYTLYLTASGSKAKPYDTKSKYAHLIPYNAFYNSVDDSLINSIEGLNFKLNNHYYIVNPSTSKIQPIVESKVQEMDKIGVPTVLLGASVDQIQGYQGITTSVAGVTSMKGSLLEDSGPVPYPSFTYYDDIPNTDPGVRLLFKLDTSKHKLRNFYIDEIDTDINNSGLTFLESNQVGAFTSPVSTEGVTDIGYLLKITKPAAVSASFTSTGMKEMSAINYKRQGDKFQVFVAVADENSNILKVYPQFLKKSTLTADYSFFTTWSSGGDSHTSVISSISTNKFPYNASASSTELSSFLYLNIDPLSAGTWTLNITGNVPGLSSQNIGSGNIGLGNVGYGNVGDASTNYLTGAYTFTVLPSTNDVEVYKINEDIDYSQTIKNYRFQSFLHEYDNLFDGIFTSFVGEASSSPTVFGKTVFEKIANFVANNNDVDFCKLDNLQSFYDFFNEDIDIVLPTPPPELKRLYDLFSIKITKLLGGYEQNNERLTSNFYTNSANGRNVDFNNKIDTSTYTVTAYTNIVARQRFNNEFVLIKPQKVATKHVDGSSSGESTTYPISTYNKYSNWGWSLDTSVSGASGLDGFYDFYPYTTYDTTSADENIKNSIVDFNNTYTSITRGNSSLSANWDNTGGIVYKNVDYQIRKGLNI